MSKTKPSKKADRREAKALARAAEEAAVKRPSAKALSEEVATASMTGVRQAWSTESMVDGLTPDKLAAILRSANQGDMDALLTLAEEMEERDPHYASVLSTRKLAVVGLEQQLTWAPGDDDDPRAAKILEACAKLIEEPAFEGLKWHALDALAKPYAAVEVDWLTTTALWRPQGYEWRDQRWFQFDRVTGRELRLKETGEPDGLPLDPWKFLVMLSPRKSGLPARGGLARLVAFSFVCKLYGHKDWMAYAEIFGIPLRLGRYGAGASVDDVEVLKRAVFGLGSDAAAVIPDSMKIEFPNLAGAGGAELFMTLVNWIDSQVSKAVLGQTGTTDMQKGGGFAQATVLNEVRGDLLKADAKWLAAAITGCVLKFFVAFNFGADAPVPKLNLVVEENEDVQVLSTALGILIPLGLKVDQDQVRKKLKLGPPPKDAELLTPPARTTPSDKIGHNGGLPIDPEPEVPDENAQARDTRVAARAQVDAIFGAARARHIEADDRLAEIQAAALDGWERVWGGEAAAVVALVQSAESFEDFTAGLLAMAQDLASPAAARSLANAMFQAAVIGQAQVRSAEQPGGV